MTTPRMEPARLELRILSDTGAPGSARRALSRLAETLPLGTLDGLQLMVSELVTNCVRHAGMRPTDLIGVRVFVFPRKVRLEVSDDGPGFEPVPPAPTIHSESGWGLFLVDQLADRWGVVSQPATSVWLEVDLPRD